MCTTLLSVFGCLTILQIPIYVIAGLVFGIQALVVGAATYQECTEIGIWLLVYGAVSLASFVFGRLVNCTCPVEDGKTPSDLTLLAKFIKQCLSLFAFGWLCYGMYLLYDKPMLRDCRPSQFDTFAMIVQFMFYSTCALFGFVYLMFFMIPCIIAERAERAELPAIPDLYIKTINLV